MSLGGTSKYVSTLKKKAATVDEGLFGVRRAQTALNPDERKKSCLRNC